MNERDIATPYFAIKYKEKLSTLQKTQRQKDQHPKNASNKVESQPQQRIQSLDIHSYPRRFHHEREKSMRQSHQIYKEEKSPSNVLIKKANNFEVNKNVPRIPIELYDEDTNGAERVKGRVIYRNNIPKNSYYLLSNMKQLPQQQNRKSRNYSQNEMEFNSKFESGNTSAVVRVSKNEYYVFMREDTNTHGLRQWYYFQARCNRPMKMNFRVYKFSKRFSLYKEGMKPYIKTQDGIWNQGGQDISYEFDESLQCYYLSFSYNFTSQGETIEVANMPPYTYSRLLRYLQSIKQIQMIRIEHIGETLGGVQIPTIQITKGLQDSTSENIRKCVIILGRTHPSQTCSNFTIESIVGKLMKSQLLLNTYDFFIVPMVNPDGVIVGNHRTGLIGMDLNRRFGAGTLQKQLFPEVQAVKSLVKRLQYSHKIQFLFDFHGHSAKGNIFAYAEQEIIGSEKYLKSRIIPKLLSHLFPPFKYSYCIFDQVRQKKNTARVFFRSKNIINAITFEQSYGLIDKNLISIQDWINFGIAFVDSLQQYTQNFLTDYQSLSQFLSQQTAIDEKNKQERIRRQRRASKSIQIQKKAVLDQLQQKSTLFLKKELQTVQCIEQEDSLDSGDEQLQITEEQLDFIHKNMIFKRRQSKQRDLLEMNDMSIELKHKPRSPQRQDTIVHQQKMPLVSRIMRMKQKQKASRDLIDILTSRHISQKNEVRETVKNLRVKLPSIPRYMM